MTSIYKHQFSETEKASQPQVPLSWKSHVRITEGSKYDLQDRLEIVPIFIEMKVPIPLQNPQMALDSVTAQIKHVPFQVPTLQNQVKLLRVDG